MRIQEYSMEGPVNLRIGLIADLHERNSRQVLDAVLRSRPDILCFAGDTFERVHIPWDKNHFSQMPLLHRLLCRVGYGINDVLERITGFSEQTDPQEVYDLLGELPRALPVFLSLGNHDSALSQTDLEVLRERGVPVLDNGCVSFLWENQRIWIGGLSTCPDLQWLDGFAAKPGYKLLLCHHPDYYPRYLEGKNIDLILAGHVHGGQIRLAGRGLFAPGQGLLPCYYRGIYHKKMVISAGCSNPVALPRLGNPCELVIVRLQKGKEK